MQSPRIPIASPVNWQFAFLLSPELSRRCRYRIVLRSRVQHLSKATLDALSRAPPLACHCHCCPSTSIALGDRWPITANRLTLSTSKPLQSTVPASSGEPVGALGCRQRLPLRPASPRNPPRGCRHSLAPRSPAKRHARRKSPGVSRVNIVRGAVLVQAGREFRQPRVTSHLSSPTNANGSPCPTSIGEGHHDLRRCIADGHRRIVEAGRAGM